ncbi:MAG: hypothetical protein WKF97_13855 [Chitinophagaceae bacterium]
MEEQVFTRQELYDLVWSESVLSLSKKYKISDVGLRKICIKNNIPLPKAGHWQKIKFAKKSSKPSLPSEHSRDEAITVMLRDENTQKVFKSLAPLIALKKEIEFNLKSKLNVPRKLINPDELIVTARNTLINKPPDMELYVGTVSTSGNGLNIRVAVGSISRALRFMNTLIKALRARGHDVGIKNGAAYVTVEGEDFDMLIREKMTAEVIKDEWGNRTIYKPTGILALRAYREWKDGKFVLESQLSKIIAYLELAAKERKDWRIKRDKERREYEERERRKKELFLRQEQELSDTIKMLEESSRFHKSQNLREYIDAVERKAVALGNDTSQQFINWLEWARKKADWYDPFIEAEDKLLKNVNRETLAFELSGDDNDDEEPE